MGQMYMWAKKIKKKRASEEYQYNVYVYKVLPYPPKETKRSMTAGA